MSAESALYRLTAVAPLIMHNARLVDPLDPWSREIAAIAGKRFKTLADHERLAKAEFFGSAWMADGRPCIPATVIEGVIVAAARTRKRGRQARSGIICTANPILLYDGPTALEELWEDPRFRLRMPVRTRGGRVMRTRPMFPEWQAEVALKFLPTLVDADALRGWLTLGGELLGVGDFRPRFGRFAVETLTADKSLGSAPIRRDLECQDAVGHGSVRSSREGRQAPPSLRRRAATSRDAK
jgi:hypothetical protein